ncbi:HET-domain-containing protein [Stipitochalara longipes BDJ]|nr:HET-domain-containing protein [Stipitochalara longipes BDJ]
MSNGSQVHPTIDRSRQQIRLFELKSTKGASLVEVVFHLVSLSTSPAYKALSYTWGDPDKRKLIEVGGERLAIPQNLWWFLHSWDSSELENPNLFWIDAICIDQENVLERNHQVRLMKQIYSSAAKVVVWLGQEADDSDIAMKFMATKGLAELKRKGCGFRRMWTRDEGKALLALCERGYWRRIWIIQEIIHARKITVLCGKKSFEWNSFEKLYGKLKILEMKSWISHHEYAGQILDSSASVMVWQRAHWRHPETPTPSLETLLEVFQDWKCSDVRDKVYGLLGMVDQATAFAVDYSKSAAELYDELRTRELKHRSADGNEYLQFCSLLREVLKQAEY